jgi:hypothetical protein
VTESEILSLKQRALNNEITQDEILLLADAAHGLRVKLDNYNSHEVFIRDLAKSWVSSVEPGLKDELSRMQSIIDAYCDKADKSCDSVKSFMGSLVAELTGAPPEGVEFPDEEDNR